MGGGISRTMEPQNICGSFLRCVYRLSARDGDTERERHQKTAMFLFLLYGVVAASLMFNYSRIRDATLGMIIGVPLVSSFVLLIGRLVCTKSISRRFIYASVVTSVIGVTTADLMEAPRLTRWWAVSIILADVLLVLRARKISQVVVAWMVFYMSVVQLEYATRFGLFDIPGMMPYDERRLDQSCDKPPCADTTDLIALPSQLLIFVLDYYFTRGFALQAEKEKAKVDASVAAAQEVAVCLATYDLEAAERALAARVDDMPAPLSSSLHTILRHLRLYKPYLPQAVFSSDHVDSFEAAIVPPPGEKGLDGRPAHVALAFTDIKGSTALWEERGEAMCKAMRIHNRLVRGCMLDLGGYEVKTIGDAFMVAFATALDAVRFGLDVQRGLREAEWPAELVENSGGLQVRIGVHYGPVTMEYNNLTERMDYLGPTVNRAARLEGAAPPGGVAVLREMYEAQGLAERLVCEAFEARDLGLRELKGVPGRFAVLSLGEPSLEPPSVEEIPVDCVSFVNSVTSADAEIPRRRPMQRRRARDSLSDTSERSVTRTVQGPPATIAGAVLVSTRCTIGHVLLRTAAASSEATWVEETQERFVQVATWVRRTEGSVAGVCGMTVLAGWGLLGRRGGSHALQAMHFARMLPGIRRGRSPRHVGQSAVACGLSTGMVSGCHVGDWEARFLAYGGRCVATASALCTRAQQLEKVVLYAAESELLDPTIASSLQPVGRVEEAPGGSHVEAYEITLEPSFVQLCPDEPDASLLETLNLPD